MGHNDEPGKQSRLLGMANATYEERELARSEGTVHFTEMRCDLGDPGIENPAFWTRILTDYDLYTLFGIIIKVDGKVTLRLSDGARKPEDLLHEGEGEREIRTSFVSGTNWNEGEHRSYRWVEMKVDGSAENAVLEAKELAHIWCDSGVDRDMPLRIDALHYHDDGSADLQRLSPPHDTVGNFASTHRG